MPVEGTRLIFIISHHIMFLTRAQMLKITKKCQIHFEEKENGKLLLSPTPVFSNRSYWLFRYDDTQ